jgi:hypothetical protein
MLPGPLHRALHTHSETCGWPQVRPLQRDEAGLDLARPDVQLAG